MDVKKIEIHCSPMHLSVSGVMKGKLFLPVGVLGAVITRLLCSPGLAELVWHRRFLEVWR